MGEGLGEWKGEEVGRSKPKRMLSCSGMLKEFEFLVGHNNIHIVLFDLIRVKRGRKKGWRKDTERVAKENVEGRDLKR